jgi:hypothetical protein
MHRLLPQEGEYERARVPFLGSNKIVSAFLTPAIGPGFPMAF